MSDTATAAPESTAGPNLDALTRAVDGDYHEIKQRVRERMSEERYRAGDRPRPASSTASRS